MPSRRTVHAALQRLGLDLVRYDADRFAALRRPPLLRERAIDVVLDVGANEGQYAQSLRDAGYAGRIVSFEPLAAAHAALAHRASADARWETRRLALGGAVGSASLHVAGNSTSSSLLPMASRHVENAPESAYVADEPVEVGTLDEAAAADVRASDRVWLKLDVQGSELSVLRGAERTLERVEVVETELSLVELYEGQALLPDVYAHLTERGFGVWFLEPVFRDSSSGELLQVDGLFARRG